MQRGAAFPPALHTTVMLPPSIRPLGEAGLVVEFDDEISPTTNGRVRALARALQSFPGVVEIVPTLRSLLLIVDPLAIDQGRLVETALQLATTLPPDLQGTGRIHEVPVVYGGAAGPDLDAVAARQGLAIEDVVRLHCAQDYVVYMLGFAPGFPYLGILPDALRIPRHPSPRLRVPRGSVAVAEALTGIYPLQTPGGWQIIGRTPREIYNPHWPEPLLFRPGDRIRFVPIPRADFPADVSGMARWEGRSRPFLEVLEPGLYTTVQDLGRTGFRDLGVPVCGAMDPLALRCVNLSVGNPSNQAALECTAPGPTLRVLRAATVVIGGANLSAMLDGIDVDLWTPISLRPGQVLRFGAPRQGMWAYLAVAGGLDIAPILGSASTYVPGALGGAGGRRLMAGDILGLGEGASRSPRAVRPEVASLPHDRLVVRVVMGPQEAWFSEVGRATLLQHAYTLTVHSNRAGIRLHGPAIAHRDRADILSDGLLPGAIQVPAGGQPIVIMADGPTTGGYPKIGVVTRTDQRLLAQSRPGTAVRFVPTTIEAAVEAYRQMQAAVHEFEQFGAH